MAVFSASVLIAGTSAVTALGTRTLNRSVLIAGTSTVTAVTPTIQISKVSSYAVSMQPAKIAISKVSSYAVSMQPEKQQISKVSSYAVEQDFGFGELYQGVGAEKPSYNDGGAGVPYISMTDAGVSFNVTVVIPGVHTFIVYNSSQVFSVFEENLVLGENTFPVTEDWNQVVMLKGSERDYHRYVYDAIKAGMEARV
jgi:hypothetical protein